MKTEQRFRILSPDGFDIDFNQFNYSKKEVKQAINKFVERFKPQGYYSTIRDNQRYQMPLSEIAENCKIIPITLRKCVATNIDYDTDGEKINLPTTLTFYVKPDLTEDEILDEISELISCETGFCHNGFNLK